MKTTGSLLITCLSYFLSACDGASTPAEATAEDNLLDQSSNSALLTGLYQVYKESNTNINYDYLYFDNNGNFTYYDYRGDPTISNSCYNLQMATYEQEKPNNLKIKGIFSEDLKTGLIAYYPLEIFNMNGGFDNKINNTSIQHLFKAGKNLSLTHKGKVGTGVILNRLDNTKLKLLSGYGEDTHLGHNFSISIWYKPSDTIDPSKSHSIISGASNWDIEFSLRPSTEGETNILDGRQYFPNDGSIAYTGIVDAGSNDWHNLVLTYDAGQIESNFSHYFNGNLIGEKVFLNSIFYDYSINFGAARDSAGRIFDGILDEIILWDRALSAGEIGELYLQQSNRQHLYLTAFDHEAFDEIDITVNRDYNGYEIVSLSFDNNKVSSDHKLLRMTSQPTLLANICRDED